MGLRGRLLAVAVATNVVLGLGLTVTSLPAVADNGAPSSSTGATGQSGSVSGGDPAPLLVAGPDPLITFSEFPVGTYVTTQYANEGIVFSGTTSTPEIFPDGANPTSPVLEGGPYYTGDIRGAFVVPGTATPGVVNTFSLDVGYIDSPGSTAVDVYGVGGGLLGSIPVNAYGIVHVTSTFAGAASFFVHAVYPDPAGFAIDNVEFPTPVAGAPGVEPQYVAFGDSVTTGYSVKSCGATDRVGDPWGCSGSRAATPYPDKVAAALGLSYSDDRSYYSQFFPFPQQQGYPDTDLDRVGIWGDTAQNAFSNYGEYTNAEGPWLPQFNAVELAHRLVTGALGANDLHFSDVASWLIPYLQDQFTLGGGGPFSAVKLRADALLAQAAPAFDQMFASMSAAKANGAQVVTVLYYNPFDSGLVLDSTICNPTYTIADTIVTELDNELQDRAQAAGLLVADPRPAFSGHGAGSGDSYVFGTDCSPAKAAAELIPSWVPFIGGGGFKAIAQDFDPHPNNEGTTAISDTVLQSLGG